MLLENCNGKGLSGSYIFSGDTIARGRFILQQMPGGTGLRKIAWMIELLDVLAHSKGSKMLASKTLIEVLKKIRINHAAKLLPGGSHNVSAACYESGYNHLFNYKQFKEIQGLSSRAFLSNTMYFKDFYANLRN